MSEDRILLQGMVFYGYHGTLAAERELGQRFVVDVDLVCDVREAGRTDDLTKTVDYSAVYRDARSIVEGEALYLTETVATRIASRVLATYDMVESVRVRVAKPQVRLDGGVLVASAVEIIRHRGEDF